MKNSHKTIAAIAVVCIIFSIMIVPALARGTFSYGMDWLGEDYVRAYVEINSHVASDAYAWCEVTVWTSQYSYAQAEVMSPVAYGGYRNVPYPPTTYPVAWISMAGMLD